MATWQKQWNGIACLQLDDGSIITAQEQIQQQFVQHFTTLFQAPSVSTLAAD